jgi:hypothetical protein
MLSLALNYVRDAVTRDQLGLRWRPRRMCLDVERGRLYVAVGEAKDGKYVAGQVVVVEL